MSLASKLDAWARSAKGNEKLQGKVLEYHHEGVERSASGSKNYGERDAYQALAKFLQVLRITLDSYGIPDSVASHINDSLCDLRKTEDGYEVCIYFDGDLSRKSLYGLSRGRTGGTKYKGYTGRGVQNIVALFNNGYNTKTVFGLWETHNTYTLNRDFRPPYGFIQRAVTNFDGNYASDFNVYRIKIAGIYWD